MASKASLIAKAFSSTGSFKEIADKSIAPSARKLSKTAMGEGATGMKTVATFNELVALTGQSAGDNVLVTGTDKLYIFDGSGWYLIATITNEAPGAITSFDNSYSLATDGTATIVTASAIDPEGFPLNWSHSVSGLTSQATVSRTNNVLTITPSSNSAHAGVFTVTMNASDGTNAAVSKTGTFTLAFSSPIAWQNSPVTWSHMTLSSNQVSWQGTYPVNGLPVTTPYDSQTVGNLPYVTLSLGRKYFEFSFERKSGHTGYAGFGLHFTPVWNQPLYAISAYTATHWSANAGLLFRASNGTTSASNSTPLTDGGYVTLHGKKDDSNASIADYSSGTYDGRSGKNSLELAQGATTDSSGRVRIGVAYDTSTRRMWFSRAGAWDWIRAYSGGWINTTLDPATTNGMSIDSATSGTDLRMYLLGVMGNDTQGHVYFHIGSDINHLPSGFSSH